MRTWVWVVAAAMVVSGTMARAADCPPPVMPPGQAVVFATPLDEPTRLGLAAAVNIALVDETGKDWPMDVADSKTSCHAGGFEVGGEAVDLWGGKDRTPPLWARMASGRMAFIAIAPSLKEAAAVTKAGATGQVTLKEKPAFVLTVADGSTWRYVTKVYDGLPSLDVIKADMAASLSGDVDLLAAYHVQSGALSLMPPTRSNRNAVLRGPLPPEGPTALIVRGDGDYFEDIGELQTRMKPSGFVCGPKFGAFPRLDMMVANASAEHRDGACRYSLGASWISIFVTRMPDAPSNLQEAATGRMASAVPGGARLTLKTPDGFFSAARRGADGLGQAILLQKRGPWVVEVRVTYVERDVAALEAATQAIATQAAATIAER